MECDAIIIGGGFAGLSAAMPLVRARRKVLLIDNHRPRNRFTRASHGFFGQDGVAPADIRATGIRQLERYPTFQLLENEVVAAHRGHDGFRLFMLDGSEHHAARIIIACGVADTLPDVPGLRERWGRSVFHCPYCDGYEIDRGPIGVLSPTELGLHHGLMMPDWGPTTLFTQATYEPDEQARAQLATRNVTIEPIPVVELLGEGDRLEAMRLADGRQLPISGLFVQPQTRVASGVAEMLGIEFSDGVLGAHIRLVEGSETSVKGVFAAGDAASPMHNATLASSAGLMAGISAHRSMLMEKIRL